MRKYPLCISLFSVFLNHFLSRKYFLTLTKSHCFLLALGRFVTNRKKNSKKKNVLVSLFHFYLGSIFICLSLVVGICESPFCSKSPEGQSNNIFFLTVNVSWCPSTVGPFICRLPPGLQAVLLADLLTNNLMLSFKNI